MSEILHILAHDHEDNVAVAVVAGLKAGTKMRGVITSDNSGFEPVARHDIPIGHKASLRA